MPIYAEIQRPQHTLLLLVSGLSVVLGWGIFIQQIVRGKPVGNNPMSDWGVWVLTALIGVGLPLFFFLIRLETTVYPDRVELRMLPFSHRVIRSTEIASVRARTYRPLREFGGWGLRGLGSNRAYSMRGHEGVQLVLRNGDRVLIGSQRPAELEAAIGSMLQSTSI